MRIGIVTTWFERGAAYVSKQFEDVFSTNNKVFIYARGGEQYAKGDPKWDQPNVTWGKQNAFSTSTEININDLKVWVKNNSLDLLLFNEQHEWEPVIECAKMDVVTGAYIDYYKKETVPLFGLYDFLICNTKRHHSVFDWHPQAFYIPWGTNTSLFKPMKKEINRDKLVFFHSAGMNPKRKGTDFILEAFDQVDHKLSKLIIHSQVDLKSFFPKKAKLIKTLLNDGSLEVIQKTVSAPGLYHLGDVYVYPSRLEGIGLTIAEAISCGLPAIVTDDQPMNEFVKTEKAGKCVKIIGHEPRRDNYYWLQSMVDVNNLRQEMNFYIGNKDKISRFKTEARLYATQNLDWKKNFENFDRELKSISKLPLNGKFPLIKKAIDFEKKRAVFYFLKTSRLSVYFQKKLKKIISLSIIRYGFIKNKIG